MNVVIGTRGSALALWQAQAVAEALHARLPECTVETRVISTKGDRVLDMPLEQIGDKGLFTKELEVALLAGEVDLCVHSMKDMPAELPDGCVIGAMLPRADARDVLVCGPRISASCLEDVPAGSRLGTGSLRRTAQLRAGFPNVEPLPIRGNVDTRLEKASGPDYEGVILAAAGVKRMGAEERVACYIPVDQMMPAVGQGAIGIEVRDGDKRMSAVCAAIDDSATSICVGVERQVLAALGGGCQVPVGVYARFEGDGFACDARVFSLDGQRVAKASVRLPRDADFDKAANDISSELFAQGAQAIMDEISGGGAS